MNLALSKGVTKKVSYQVSLNLNVNIANLVPLVESFLLGHGPALPASGSAFWTRYHSGDYLEGGCDYTCCTQDPEASSVAQLCAPRKDSGASGTKVDTESL